LGWYCAASFAGGCCLFKIVSDANSTYARPSNERWIASCALPHPHS
jgi:hypothetical protein